MRRPLYLKQTSAAKQQGFALFIVLMIMIVIALLVVAVTQSYNTEQRISTNDADRKLATSLAEAALRQGEHAIIALDDKTVTFTENCAQGLCQAVGAISSGNHVVEGAGTEDAWKRKPDNNNPPYIDTNGLEYAVNTANSGISKNPRYIIEYLSTDTSGKTIYRVTAKAWGKNENTVVMLQSYVSNE